MSVSPVEWLDMVRDLVIKHAHVPDNVKRALAEVPIEVKDYPKSIFANAGRYGETAFYPPHLITIYRQNVEYSQAAAFVLVHELAHAVLGEHYGHPMPWAEMALRLGIVHPEGNGNSIRLSSDPARWNPGLLADIKALPKPDGLRDDLPHRKPETGMLGPAGWFTLT